MYPPKKTVRIKIKTKNKTPPSHFSSEGGVVTLPNAGNYYLGDQSIRRKIKRRRMAYLVCLTRCPCPSPHFVSCMCFLCHVVGC